MASLIVGPLPATQAGHLPTLPIAARRIGARSTSFRDGESHARQAELLQNLQLSTSWAGRLHHLMAQLGHAAVVALCPLTSGADAAAPSDMFRNVLRVV
jgi:hypothetical protein